MSETKRFAIVRDSDGQSRPIPEGEYNETLDELVGWLDTEALEAPVEATPEEP